MKKFLKKGNVGLLLVLLLSGGLESKSLKVSPALNQELEKARVEISKKPILQPEGAGVKLPIVDIDKYVQTEAHLQVDAVKTQIAKIDMYLSGGVKDQRTSNELVTPYMNIIASVIDREVALKNSHYALYNGTNNEWRVPQDLYKQLYAYNNPLQSVKDFVFVRFSDLPSIKAEDFLRDNVAEWAGVNDNMQEVRDVLISANLALFGGVGTQGECTWNYFLTAKSHRWPTALHYYQVLKAFGMSYDIELLAKETQLLSEMLVNATPEQTLLQIFIPQNKIDDMAYISWILGVPYHQKSVDLVEKRLEGKERTGSTMGPAVKAVMKKIRKDPAYKELHEELKAAVENGDFGVRAFMDEYRNKPWSIKNINEIQARLLTTKDIQNPGSGIKMFSYFTTPRDIQENYLKKLDILVKKIIDQENHKTPAQKAIDMAKNEETFKRLAAAEKAERDAAKKAEKKK